jgi:hypothetical protein
MESRQARANGAATWRFGTTCETKLAAGAWSSTSASCVNALGAVATLSRAERVAHDQQDLDATLRLVAKRKISNYKQQYADNQNISFLPALSAPPPANLQKQATTLNYDFFFFTRISAPPRKKKFLGDRPDRSAETGAPRPGAETGALRLGAPSLYDTYLPFRPKRQASVVRILRDAEVEDQERNRV